LEYSDFISELFVSLKEAKAVLDVITPWNSKAAFITKFPGVIHLTAQISKALKGTYRST